MKNLPALRLGTIIMHTVGTKFEFQKLMPEFPFVAHVVTNIELFSGGHDLGLLMRERPGSTGKATSFAYVSLSCDKMGIN